MKNILLLPLYNTENWGTKRVGTGTARSGRDRVGPELTAIIICDGPFGA